MTDHPEKILCIKSEKLFEKGKWDGLKTDNLEYYRELILKNQEFRPRNELEEDPNYKQVITRVILRYNDRYYLHRMVHGTETRLNGLCPLPLGGHIEEFDKDQYEDKDIIEAGLIRELEEEVDLNAQIIDKNFLGLIYMEYGQVVSTVHVGLVYIFDIDNDDVHVKEEELEDIGFVDLDYLQDHREELTYWTRLIINYL
jgi:predicted NUDIX family phosphoesterase